MRAILCTRLGGPEVLELQEVPEPAPAEDKVLIRVRRAGVNFADLASMRGRYAQAPSPPFVPGLEVSGTEVVSGRSVIALVGSGGYAEIVAADRRMVFPANGLDLELAAGYLLVSLTAYFGLAEVARLRPGETVLVTAAAGGIGTAAIQTARALGAAQVIGIASTPEKRDFAREVGADIAIGYDDDVPEPLDVVVDTVGASTFRKLLALVRPLGRMVLIGSSSGEVQEIPSVGDLRVRAVGIFPFSLGAIRANHPDLFAERAAPAVDLIRQGKVRPPVGRVLPLVQAAQAHRLMASRQSMGKILLDVSSPP